MEQTPQESQASREQAKQYIDITEVIAGIQMKRSQALERKINVYARTHFIASDITDCDKYATHSILDWEQKERFTPSVIARLEVGNKEELNLISELSALGYQIIHSQAPFEIKHPKTGEVMCRGKIDGKLHVDRHNQFPIEFKSISPNLFDMIDTYEDLDRLPHLRKYKRQMQLYLYGNQKDVGVILFSNLLGAWKFIVVYRDDAEVEFILKRLEANWDLVKAKKHGKPILYDEKICGRCAFRHVCLPDIKREGAEMIEDAELERRLAKLAELKPLAKQYESLDDTVKEFFKTMSDNSRTVFVGTDWRVDVVVREGQRLDQKLIPEDIKSQYQKPTVTKTVSFNDITRGMGVQTQKQKADDESAGAKDAPAPQGSAPAPVPARRQCVQHRTQGSPAKKAKASSAVADKLAKMKKEVAKESKEKTKKKKGA